MKFNGFLLVIALLLFSCNEVTDNLLDEVIPEPDTLEVGKKKQYQL